MHLTWRCYIEHCNMARPTQIRLAAAVVAAPKGMQYFLFFALLFQYSCRSFSSACNMARLFVRTLHSLDFVIVGAVVGGVGAVVLLFIAHVRLYQSVAIVCACIRVWFLFVRLFVFVFICAIFFLHIGCKVRYCHPYVVFSHFWLQLLKLLAGQK